MTGTWENIDAQLLETATKTNAYIEKFKNRTRKTEEVKEEYHYTNKQKKLFHKTFSGLQVGFHRKEMLIFLTLTTEYQAGTQKQALQQSEEQMNDHWQKLKQNVDYNVQKWRFDNWLTATYGPIDPYSKEGRAFYHERRRNAIYDKRHTMWEHFKFKLCYMKVRTTEGGGVLHVLIRKSRQIPIIAQKFLRKEWDRIHGAEQVWIEEIKVDPEKGLQEAMNASFYFCGNYFNQQPVVRQSSSYNWIFKGAQAVWSRGKKVFAPKRKRHEYHPACSCEECLRTNPRNPAPNEYLNRIYGPQPQNAYTNVSKTTKENILLKRPSILQLCMKSRKATKTSGYNNALFLWLQLTRNPPVQHTQKKLTRKHHGEVISAY